MKLQWIMIGAASALVALTGCEKKQVQTHEMPPPEVTVARPERTELHEWDEYTGRLEAKETVEIRPRVSGTLDAVHFSEGMDVEEKAPLFTIDPRPYKAAEAGAQAEYDRALNRETQMKSERDRARALAGTKAMSAEDFETREKSYLESQATTRAAKAALDMAALNVEFTQIRAPITGRISLAMVTKGNYVTAGTTMLTMLVSTSPVYLYVDIDESSALKYQKLYGTAAGKDATKLHIPCVMRLGDDAEWKHEGHIDFMDNRVDPGTGTMRVRAKFENIKGPALAPGLFARLRVPGSEKYTAVLVPDACIGSDQAMKYVYVVDEKVWRSAGQ